MMIDKLKTVAFTGHRTSKICTAENGSKLRFTIFKELHNTIMKLQREGYNTYLCGMADGFDLLSAEAVIKIKRYGFNIQLIAVVPFRGHSMKMSYKSKIRYQKIIDHAAEVIYIADKEDRQAYLDRNDYMLDNCRLLICYYEGKRGGTMYTVNRARKAEIPIINIYETVIR